MTDNKFTWVPFFKEVHEKIHSNYNAQQLAKIANEIFGYVKDFDSNGVEIPIQEMTPINLIARFNRRISRENKINYCKKLKELMNLNSEAPSDFGGIPEFDNKNCLCMKWEKDREDYIIQEQWEISKQILEDNINTQLFDKILSSAHPWIGLSYLSRFCFIVKPEKYYPYDKQMVINLNVKTPKTYKDYENYCKLLKATYPEKTSYELSYESFITNNDKQFPRSQQKYWLFAAGKSSEKWEEFHKDGVMACAWDEVNVGKLNNSKIHELDNNYFEKHPRIVTVLKDMYETVSIGDIIYVKRGESDVIARGVVKSDYFYDENRKGYEHCRQVEWTNVREFKKVQTKNFRIGALIQITENTALCERLENL